MDIEAIKLDPSIDYQYYHVIPDFVLCHPTISSNSIKLFCKITGLCNLTGFCWASNAYFTEKLHWSQSTVKRALGELRDLNFIDINFEIGKDKKVEKRIITTHFKKLKSIENTQSKSELGGRSNLSYPQSKSDLYNSTNIIKKKNNKPSANFSNFKRVKLISDMDFNTWQEWEIQRDKESFCESKKQGVDGDLYFQKIRLNQYNRLCASGATINYKNE